MVGYWRKKDTLTTGGYPKCSVKSSVSELADVVMAHDLDVNVFYLLMEQVVGGWRVEFRQTRRDCRHYLILIG